MNEQSTQEETPSSAAPPAVFSIAKVGPRFRWAVWRSLGGSAPSGRGYEARLLRARPPDAKGAALSRADACASALAHAPGASAVGAERVLQATWWLRRRAAIIADARLLLAIVVRSRGLLELFGREAPDERVLDPESPLYDRSRWFLECELVAHGPPPAPFSRERQCDGRWRLVTPSGRYDGQHVIGFTLRMLYGQTIDGREMIPRAALARFRHTTSARARELFELSRRLEEQAREIERASDRLVKTTRAPEARAHLRIAVGGKP